MMNYSKILIMVLAIGLLLFNQMDATSLLTQNAFSYGGQLSNAHNQVITLAGKEHYLPAQRHFLTQHHGTALNQGDPLHPLQYSNQNPTNNQPRMPRAKWSTGSIIFVSAALTAPVALGIACAIKRCLRPRTPNTTTPTRSRRSRSRQTRRNAINTSDESNRLSTIDEENSVNTNSLQHVSIASNNAVDGSRQEDSLTYSESINSDTEHSFKNSLETQDNEIEVTGQSHVLNDASDLNIWDGVLDSMQYRLTDLPFIPGSYFF